MSQFTLQKSIAASPEAVFAAICDISNMQQRIPEIQKIELLTPEPFGLGSKFRETRIVFGREATETFEVTEFQPPSKITLVASSCGVMYQCEHRIMSAGTGTTLELAFRMKALTFVAKLMTPMSWMMKGVMKKAMAKDLDSLARSLEAPNTPPQ